MARFLSPRRSLVFGFLLSALVLAAQQPVKWDALLGDSIAAIKAGNAAESIQLLLPLYERAKALPAQANALPADDVRRVETALVLATAYQYHGQLDQAEPLYLEAIQWLEAGHGTNGSMLAPAFDNLGRLRLEQGRWREAEELLGKARDLYSKTRNARDPRIADVNRLIGETYLSQGRMAEAVTLLEQSLVVLRRAPDVAVQTVAAALRSLATAYTIQARYLEAEKLLEESIQLNRASAQAELDLADSTLALGHLFLLLRDTARATPLIEKAVRVFDVHEDSHLPNALSELGAAALQDGKYEIAKEYLGRALDLQQKQFGWDRVSIALIEAGLAEAYFGERNYDHAEALIQQAIATEQSSVGKAHFTVARLLMVEATIEAKQRRSSEADAHYRQALEIYQKTFAADHPDLVSARRDYALFTKTLRK
jgi:tetratricopeptide (TPR) repeat protein